MGFWEKKDKNAAQGDSGQKEIRISADEAFDIAEAFWSQGKYDDSFRYYTIAANQGHLRAINCLGCSYRYGEGVSADVQKALYYFETALAAGYSKAAGHIGQIYYDGESGVKCDYKKAIPLLQRSALAGNGFAMHTLSDAYYHGNGCESNEKLAAYWAYQAAQRENADAFFWLGIYFDEGIFFPVCPAIAKYYFEKAADIGYDVAEYLESDKYLVLDAVEPDTIKFNDSDPAFFTQECPYQQYLRSLYLLNGRDKDNNIIPVNPAAGKVLLELSAAQGYAEAQFSLGAKYLNTGDGNGIQYDDYGGVLSLGCDTKKALYYLDLAARQGHPDALNALIDLYGMGEIEIEQDIEKSNEYRAMKYKLFQDEDDCPDDDAEEEYDFGTEDEDEADSEDEAEQDRHFARLQYKGGDVYEGEVENNIRNGEGKYTYASGSTYEGSFCDDLFEGYGEYRNARGDTYAGDYHLDRRHGYGEATYTSQGKSYKGGWRNDKWEGVGRLDYSNGAWYFGQFSSGVINGYGVYFDGENYHIGLFEEGRCVTELRVKATMRRPVLSNIGEGATCYCDLPRNTSGYSIFKRSDQTLYARNDGSWLVRYSTAAKKMELGAVDSQSRLNDENAVTIHIDSLVAIGRVTAGVPNGRTVLQYLTGETVECEFKNGQQTATFQITDRLGNIKE